MVFINIYHQVEARTLIVKGPFWVLTIADNYCYLQAISIEPIFYDVKYNYLIHPLRLR